MQVLSLPEVLEKIMCAMVREEFGESIVIQKEYDQQLSSQRSLQRLKIHKVC
jgi:nitrogen-specific signal transduction histidine kinase